ncbi:MAG TPA: HGGxSTG domain-containing protein [Candidatus Angelobacter sp.]|nr:HGGxSTG domain-containing protein [Candidatus Angelobacter sp.]
MPNGRCRLHGGLSTGPRTPAGLDRSRRARWKHGGRSTQVRALLGEARLQARRTRALRARLSGSSAGHGVDRSNSRSPVGARCTRPSSSASTPSSALSRVNDPRAHAARPDANQLGCSASAGHGVHRANSQPPTIGVHPPSRSPLRRAKEGRSFRDRLCSSAPGWPRSRAGSKVRGRS